MGKLSFSKQIRNCNCINWILLFKLIFWILELATSMLLLSYQIFYVMLLKKNTTNEWITRSILVLVLLTHGDLCGLYYLLYIHVHVFTQYKYKNCKNIYITQYQKIVKTTEMTPTMWHWFCREHAGKVIRHHLWHSLMDQRLRRLDWRFFLDIQLLLCWSLQKIYVIYEINLTFTHLNNNFTLCFT